MDIRTDSIENSVVAYKNDIIWVAVIASEVYNLDTYQVEIEFDDGLIQFLGGYEDSQYNGIENLLKINGGETLSFKAVEHKPGLINIANSMPGINEKFAPEGSGVIAIIQFKVLSEHPTSMALRNVNFLDVNNVRDQIRKLSDGTIN
ncbi:MAG: hypothetical protein OMM_05938 [Candidatus Magnetoglobus multicellularis str. Araruama]|uniref:Uncharacterized protein n=1 Tax=Candidatus Magnetoglobus multicellularis str. Araruama TaxID=890399 RepID=A0A1V1NT05_9BACT|nr:MAG: hypothetical protein OMM_05938 [Candidatus Magnetoglobus multicellularis str. Araruama]